MTMRSYVGILVVLLLAACGGGEAPPEDTAVTATEAFVVLPAGRQLLIDGYAGRLILAGRNDSTATFTVTKHARGAGDEAAQALLDGITVDSSKTADTYTLRIISSRPEETSADVQAQVPYRTPLRLDLEQGTVSVEAVSAPLRAVVDSGAVAIKGAANDIEVEMGTGNVTVNMVGFREETDVDIAVDHGDVELVLPASAAATVEAVAQVGRIDASGLSLQERADSTTTGGMRLSGRLGNGTGRVLVRTGNGSITLRGGQ